MSGIPDAAGGVRRACSNDKSWPLRCTAFPGDAESLHQEGAEIVPPEPPIEDTLMANCTSVLRLGASDGRQAVAELSSHMAVSVAQIDGAPCWHRSALARRALRIMAQIALMLLSLTRLKCLHCPTRLRIGTLVLVTGDAENQPGADYSC